MQRTSCYPEHNILDFSHTCLAISPQHPHYGTDGQFNEPQACEVLWSRLWERHKTKKPFRLGALSRYNARHYRIQRLRYNPDFNSMMQLIDKFISTEKE